MTELRSRQAGMGVAPRDFPQEATHTQDALSDLCAGFE